MIHKDTDLSGEYIPDSQISDSIKFSLADSNPSKESNIYSLAITAYEVRYVSPTPCIVVTGVITAAIGHPARRRTPHG